LWTSARTSEGFKSVRKRIAEDDDSIADSEQNENSDKKPQTASDILAHQEEELEYVAIQTIHIPEYDEVLLDARTSTMAKSGLPLVVEPGEKYFDNSMQWAKDCCHDSATVVCSVCCVGMESNIEGTLGRHTKIPVVHELNTMFERKSRRLHQDLRINADSGEMEALPLIDRDLEEIDGDQLDGIFSDISPLLIPVLLHGESVLPSITNLTGRNMVLSRATQRLLREIKSTAAAPNGESPTTAAPEIPVTPTTIANNSNNNITNNNTAGLYSMHSNLIQFLDVHENEPILRVINSPLDFSFKRIIFPECNPDFGGQLGEWNDNSHNLTQRLGPLPLSYQHRGAQGSILKIFIFQLELSEHPWMNSEEKAYARLKQYYNQYVSIFEQQTIEFLAMQTHRLMEE
jgi:hypothetical protein